ncbi:MAG: hypothetical protein JWN76_839 [Chitinophagaceae bacterium]|nr:hypothetical protein [Chitinophagaceae bacterium]
MRDNKLEKFIVENKSDFDTEQLPVYLWQKLEKKLPSEEKRFRLFNLFSLQQAAAAVIIIAVGLAFLVTIDSRKPIPPGENNNPALSAETNEVPDNINPVYTKQILQFSRIVDTKQTQLKEAEKISPELYKDFTKDLTSLDAYYKSLAKELKNNPRKEQLLDEMIQNLRLQAELLNQQLNVIQELKQSKKQDHAKDKTHI